VSLKPELGAEERAAIVAEWRRLRDEPPPTNPRPYGCATFLIALALFLIVPVLLGLFGWKMPQAVEIVFLAIAGLAMLGGFFAGVFVGSGAYGRAYSRAVDALNWLAADDGSGDPQERMRQAVSVIFNAEVSDGPTSSNTVDRDEAVKRLGGNLPYVIAVERALWPETRNWTYFGDSKDASTPKTGDE
jgi:hypothetical protein